MNGKLDERRMQYIERLGMDPWKRWDLPDSLLDQLDRCKSDEARRLILGVSVKQPSRKEKGIIRHRIYERSGGFCEECHRYIIEEAGEWGSMHASHIKSKGAGGLFTVENLRALCLACHLVGVHNKKSVPPKGMIQ